MKPANRMELLASKQQKKLAEKGHSLLIKKRDALIREFFRAIKEYQEAEEQTKRELARANDLLQRSQAISGSNRVKGIALSTEAKMEVHFEKKNIMGVRVPKIALALEEYPQNTSPIGTCHYVTQTQEIFSELLPKIISLAELEQTIYALADEIKKTKRRVNALEHIRIPQIQQEIKQIRERLEEREREEFVRIKHLKKR